MKTIDCWAGMQPYGIVPLTSEPDGLKYRIVCDVTAKGKQLIEKALGVAEVQLEMNWDYGTNDEPHVGCLLLSPEILSILGVYALLDDGCHEVWMTEAFASITKAHPGVLQNRGEKPFRVQLPQFLEGAQGGVV